MKHSKLTILLALLMAFLMIPSALAETFSSEVTWEDPITGTQSGQLTINPETEQWTISFETPFGSYEVGGDYTLNVTMEVANDGGLGEFFPGDALKVSVPAAIAALYSSNLHASEQAAAISSYEINWEDPITGSQSGTLTIDPATEQWIVAFSTPFGAYEVGGDYTNTANGVEVEITNDGGLGEFLPADGIKGAVSAAIPEMLKGTDSKSENTAEISWDDPVTGNQPATLTINPETEQWTIAYTTPFGAYEIGGDYTKTDAGYELEITNDGGAGEWLPAEQIRGAATPAIEAILASSVVQNADHVHKWRDGVCKVCGLECAHQWGEGTGVCTICSMRCTHLHHDSHSLLCEDCGLVGYHTYVDGTCSCGATTIFEYHALPESYKQPAEQTGTVEELTYETFAYTADGTAGEALTKRALVYLPYGYDASKNYNILYLLHGGGEDETSWFNIGDHDEPKGVNTLYVLDHAIADGLCDPMIVVTPTFNGNDTDSFWAEVKNELIPAVETKYATFAKGDVSAENIKATRAYRAFAGFSMGSQTSLESILKHCTDEFGYVGSYSAGLGNVATTEEELAEAIRAQGNSMYYWFNANGYIDMAHDDHQYTYFKMMELASDLFQDGVNSCWIDKPYGTHNWTAWEIDLYNCLKVFFKLDAEDEAPELTTLQAEQALR